MAIVQAGRDLFASKGVAATSLREIAEDAGIQKGSLAYHFPGGKQEIVIAAIASAAAEVSDAIDAVLWTESGIVQGFRAMSEMIARELERSGWAWGCPISTIALEQSSDERIRRACARAFEQWVGIAARRFERDGLPPQRARELAELGMTTIVGALIVARTQRDTAVILHTGAIIAAVFTDAIDTAANAPAGSAPI